MSNPGKLSVSSGHAPAAIGPYSQAVRSGDLIFASGQVALDPASSKLIEGGIREQTVRVLDNLQAVLAAAGSDLREVVKTVVFLKNIQDFAAMNEIYAAYLAPAGVTPPARSTIEVSRLPKDALVEIEAIARLA